MKVEAGITCNECGVRLAQMKLTILLALLFIITNQAAATTIVAVKTPREIVVGADSKVTDAFGNAFASQACKIMQAGNLVFAYEGMARDKESGFSITRTASEALLFKTDASMSEKVSILTGFITTQLFAELNYLKQHHPDVYREKIEGQAFLKILVAGFEKDKPLLFVRYFRAAPLTPKVIGVSVTPDDCLADCQGAALTRFLGETEAIDGLPEETPGFWKNGTVAGVRRLIETEIEARSEYVGPPIDIVRIDRNGAEWIQKKPECPVTDTHTPQKNRPLRRRRS